jgi:hypothetical protein
MLKLQLLSLALLCLPGFAHAQTSAFTYTGRLNNNGTPVTGAYDLRVTLYDANAAGNVVAGPLPIVPVGVTNGVFTAVLDFGAGVFTGQARWLNIEVRPTGGGLFTTLAPRQEVTSSPYAIRAQTAGTAASVANGAVTAGQLNTGGLPPAPGQFLSYNGGNLFWSDPGVAAGNIWSQLNNNAYYTAGKVGIGTTTPSYKLDVFSDVTTAIFGRSTAVSGVGVFGESSQFNGVRGLAHNANHGAVVGVHDGGGPAVYGTGAIGMWGDIDSATGYGGYFRNTAGGVALGVEGKTQLLGQDTLQLVGYNPFLTLYDSNAGYARSRIQGVGGGLNLFTESYLIGANSFAYLRLDNNGNVGIGSATPVGKLEVVAQDALRLVGYQPFLTILDSSAGYARSRIQGAGGDMIFESESYLNGSDPNAYAKFFNSGNFSVKTLTIRGGADLAEPFEFSGGDVAKGSVLVIDDEQPGKLKLSDRPYDTRVAGIASGANGVNPGISLHQEGIMEGGQNLALSGRVYVLADATLGAIRPGDLLTTSGTPGHAMKVSKPGRAQGAILGKAMSGLKEGKGMVLVLVTLQ